MTLLTAKLLNWLTPHRFAAKYSQPGTLSGSTSRYLVISGRLVIALACFFGGVRSSWGGAQISFYAATRVPQTGDRWPVLAREIFRQALISSARDYLGVESRDIVLRERRSARTSTVVETDFIYNKDGAVSFTAKSGNLDLISYTQQLDLTQEPLMNEMVVLPYAQMIALAERESRAVWPIILGRGLGLEPVHFADNPGLQIDPEFYADLNSFDLLLLFKSIRRLHGALGAGDRSAQVLLALARAYADLGFTTSYLPSSLPEVFAARSLIYAQRARVLYPDLSEAVYTRSYCLALAGLPNLALKEAQDWARARQELLPRWLAIVRAYIQNDFAVLNTLAKKATGPRLQIFYIRLLSNNDPDLAVVAYGNQALRRMPRSFYLHQTMIAAANSFNRRQLMVAASKVFVDLSAQLVALPEVPANVQAAFGRLVVSVPDELQRRAEGVGALMAADGDSRGLSWSVLGALVLDISFQQIWDFTNYLVYDERLDPRPYLLDMDPLLRLSSRSGMVKAMGYEFVGDYASEKKELVNSNYDDPKYSFVSRLVRAARHQVWQVTMKGSANFWSRINYSSSNTVNELTQHLSYATNLGEQGDYAVFLWSLDKYSYTARAVMLLSDYQVNKQLLPVWEQDASSKFLLKLARAALVNKDNSTAKRLLQKAIALAPYDLFASELLARFYLDQGELKPAIAVYTNFMQVDTPAYIKASAAYHLASLYHNNNKPGQVQAYLGAETVRYIPEAKYLALDLGLPLAGLQQQSMADDVTWLLYRLAADRQKGDSSVDARIKGLDIWYRRYGKSPFYGFEKIYYLALTKAEKFLAKAEKTLGVMVAERNNIQAALVLADWRYHRNADRFKGANAPNLFSNVQRRMQGSAAIEYARLAVLLAGCELHPEKFDYNLAVAKLRSLSAHVATDGYYLLGRLLAVKGQGELSAKMLELAAKQGAGKSVMRILDRLQALP